MKTSTKILLALTATFVVCGIVTWSIYGIDWWQFSGVLWFAFVFLGAYVYLYASKVFADKKARSEYDEHKSFDACWRAMNRLLSERMPGQNHSFVWNEGFNQKSTMRTFVRGNETRNFRALIGKTKTGDQVIAIWDIDNRDIVAWNAQPLSRDFDDPFNEKNFKPWDTPKIAMGFDPRNRRGRTRLGVSYPGAGLSFSDGQISDNMVDSAINNLEQ